MSFPSRCSADSDSEFFHEYTTFLQETVFLQPFLIGRASNWTYTRLRIARTLNWAESEIFLIFPRTAQPIQVRSSSTNIRPPYSLSQLTEHPIKHTHDWELREDWIELRVRFYTFSLTAQLLEHMVIRLRVRVHLAGLRVNTLMRIIYARVPPG